MPLLRAASGAAPRTRATVLVVLLGVVSLFADMTYESARSVLGPFLALLGAGAATVGVAAGLGELLGYMLRFVSGNLVDRNHRYWNMMLVGFCVNLLAVPLLALVDHWREAVCLMFLERAGKAIRTPPRDALLSFAGSRMGRGWGFALHEVLDQTGATVGPLLMAAVLSARHDYRLGFALLLVPALFSLGFLLVARRAYPRPHDLEAQRVELETAGFARPFWWYLAATACIAAGFADYPLIAFHFGRTGTVPPDGIALLYALAMAVEGLAALALGALYDRAGAWILCAAAALAIPVAPLVFLGGFDAAVAGAVLWGAGMGAQESVMKAQVAALSPAHKRGAGFGWYNLGFGVFWFLGSSLMGYLYEVSLAALVLFSVLAQVAAVPLLALVLHRCRRPAA